MSAPTLTSNCVLSILMPLHLGSSVLRPEKTGKRLCNRHRASFVHETTCTCHTYRISGTELHIVFASCVSVQKSKLQRSCPGCIFPDLAMGSSNTMPPPVSLGTESTNEHPSAIGDRANDGGGPPSPNQSPIGPAERHADIVFFKLGPFLKCCPVPRMHPPIAIHEEGMTYHS